MSCFFGAIADDFTGGSDLAGMLFENGARTVQIFGPQPEPFIRSLEGRYQAAVLCLKSRSIPAADACRMSLEALAQLQILRPAQIQFKYCSTFDSTSEGNIGPVTDALMERLGTAFTVAVPALPVNGRTQYMGHLFLGPHLLSDTHMRLHPLNPMTDSSLVRHLQRQTNRRVGLIPLAEVQAGAAAVRAAMGRLEEEGVAIALVDATTDRDLDAIAEAVADLKLITGGSGLGMKLPKVWGLPAGAPVPAPSLSGGTLVLSGSCSAATLEQLDSLRNAGCPVVSMNVRDLGPQEIERLLAEAGENSVAAIRSSAPPEAITGGAAPRIEAAFADIARRFVEQRGVRKIVVAGGETSGAVVSALGIPAVEITAILDPGVPALRSLGDPPLSLALKSGNFGSVDFFSKAIRYLNPS